MTTQVTPNFKPARKTKRRPRRHERPGMDPEYLKKIRRLPCCVSGSPAPSEAHHLRYAPERGIALRATDRFAIPLSWHAHNAVHRIGSRQERKWFKERGIDAYELAKALWNNSHSEDAMFDVLTAHREGR